MKYLINVSEIVICLWSFSCVILVEWRVICIISVFHVHQNHVNHFFANIFVIYWCSIKHLFTLDFNCIKIARCFILLHLKVSSWTQTSLLQAQWAMRDVKRDRTAEVLTKIDCRVVLNSFSVDVSCLVCFIWSLFEANKYRLVDALTAKTCTTIF